MQSPGARPERRSADRGVCEPRTRWFCGKVTVSRRTPKARVSPRTSGVYESGEGKHPAMRFFVQPVPGGTDQRAGFPAK